MPAKNQVKMVRKFKFLRVFTSMALLVVNHSILLPTNEEQKINIRNISSLVTSVTLSPPPPIHFLGYTLPQGHPCHTFTLPPPPANNKRTGPRPLMFPLESLVRLIVHTSSRVTG
ncbi:probable hexosyltransferase MUCI70 [Raphanus sativus]|uniref:Probable hexosyltransferase MUCI70 n=1 Tax=Raphanus sativus TaxID=3726 RepID=A0A9W3CFP3_RAPSA|nr:probable hexosyltransferase MUCI70 [Raphanus sativus]